jgi:ribosomal protein S18 acetylase RimI-like enzyme
MSGMEIRQAADGDRAWIRKRLIEFWGSPMVALRGVLLDASDLPALVYGDNEGVLHHRPLDDLTYEIVTLEAYRQWRGIGTALVDRVAAMAKEGGYRELAVVTTNDNLDALQFYQARGFRLFALRAGAVDKARELKPEIAPTGNYGLPIRDELELRRTL